MGSDGKIEIERLGGFAGFGQTGSHLRSRGELRSDQLSSSERKAVDAIFDQAASTPAAARPDAFRYRLTRQGPAGAQTVEVAEEQVPATLQRCIKDELI